ncbi:MAG: DUF6364 family protein [Candidatus Cloacimonetes bacterium]|nr:DUF6364 family protein [Candidatus Cloacimonadota bacterium]
METTIELKIEHDVFMKAQEYSMNNGKDLSDYLVDFIFSLSKKQMKNEEKNGIHPLVKEITGVFKRDKEIDYKETIVEYLKEKYN